MLVGDVTTGRLLAPRVRGRLGAPFLLLLATPYLLFALHPGIAVSAACAAVASVGFGSSLIQQERLMALTPEELGGHALGLHSSGMLTLQGASAALAGSVAQLTSPGAAMTVMATASLAVTAALTLSGRGRKKGRGKGMEPGMGSGTRSGSGSGGRGSVAGTTPEPTSGRAKPLP